MGFLDNSPPALTSGLRGGTRNPAQEALNTKENDVIRLTYCPFSIGTGVRVELECAKDSNPKNERLSQISLGNTLSAGSHTLRQV